MKKNENMFALTNQGIVEDPVEIASETEFDDEKIVMVTLRMTAAQRKNIQQIALNMNTSAKDLVLKAIDEFKTKRGLY